MSKKLTYNYVKEYIEKNKYKLISTNYVNNSTKLHVQCQNKHDYTVTWGNFLHGKRCPFCAISKRAEKKRLNLIDIRKFIESQNYKLLSTSYVDAHKKLILQCDQGHIYNVTWNDFQQGKRCKKCAFIKLAEDRKHSYNYVKQFIEKEGYKLISKTYKNNRIKLKIVCPNQHYIKMSFTKFQAGERCRICFKVNQADGKNSHFYKCGPDVAWYDTYAPQLDWCEKVRRDLKNKDILQVKCTNSDCRKWFNPNSMQVRKRINALKTPKGGECRFYCSDECKQSCSIYNQKLYPKGFTNTESIRYDQTEWATMVKERDDYTCQRCGSTEDLVAHHIEGLNENPIESADIDLGITLCKKCHNLAHNELGCRPIDLTKNKICGE